jgi:tetratricopeptide (TPR) repeat protein
MERAARRCWNELGELGEAGFRSTAGTHLAEALARLGKLDEAETIIGQAETIASVDDYVTHYLALNSGALIASRRAEHDRAIERARRAITVVEQTDAIEHQAIAHLVAAEVLVAADRVAEAERDVAQTIHLAEQKGLVVIAERADALTPPSQHQ